MVNVTVSPMIEVPVLGFTDRADTTGLNRQLVLSPEPSVELCAQMSAGVPPTASWSLTVTSVKLNIPAPCQLRLLAALLEESAMPLPASSLELNVMLPALATLAESVKSPVPVLEKTPLA